jgi:hypothetical protein
MKEIQTRELERCLKFIKAIGCKYAIVTNDGVRYVDGLEIAEPRIRKPRRYPYGTISTYVRSVVPLDAAVGAVIGIPTKDLDPETVCKGVRDLLIKEWGKDTYVTVVRADDGIVDVMRTA